MRKMLLFAGALVLGCCAAASVGRAVEITFYHYQAGANYEAFRRILDDFERQNPGIVVADVFSQSQQITAEVQTTLAARRPLDIATVIGKNILFFLENTPAVAIDEEPAKATFLDNYLPSFLDIGRANGKVYAVPHAYGTPLLFYNKDLFREAGLDAETPPETWEQVVAAAKAVQERTGAAGFAHLLASNKDYGTMLLVMNAGSRYLSADGRCAAFDTPEGIAALQLWQDLVLRHKVMPIANDRQYTAALTSGQLAMYVNSSAGLGPTYEATKERFELGVAPYPRMAAGQTRRVPNSGAALMLYAPAGERRDAALKLLAYLSSREVSNRWARESGYMPLAKEPLRDPEMAAYVEGFPLARPVIEQMAETVPTATWGETGALEAQTLVSNLTDQLWAGQGSAAELVPTTVERMNEAMGCTAR